jgi:methylthioribose-1-phosphate isomerase
MTETCGGDRMGWDGVMMNRIGKFFLATAFNHHIIYQYISY